MAAPQDELRRENITPFGLECGRWNPMVGMNQIIWMMNLFRALQTIDVCEDSWKQALIRMQHWTEISPAHNLKIDLVCYMKKYMKIDVYKSMVSDPAKVVEFAKIRHPTAFCIAGMIMMDYKSQKFRDAKQKAINQTVGSDNIIPLPDSVVFSHNKVSFEHDGDTKTVLLPDDFWDNYILAQRANISYLCPLRNFARSYKVWFSALPEGVNLEDPVRFFASATLLGTTFEDWADRPTDFVYRDQRNSPRSVLKTAWDDAAILHIPTGKSFAAFNRIARVLGTTSVNSISGVHRPYDEVPDIPYYIV